MILKGDRFVVISPLESDHELGDYVVVINNEYERLPLCVAFKDYNPDYDEDMYDALDIRQEYIHIDKLKRTN